MPTIRKRYQFKFWLDALKSDEFELGKQLEQLKKTRKYAVTIRDALRLLFSLRERKTDVLFSMFPWLVDELKPKTDGGNGNGGREFKQQLDRLEQLMLQQKLPNEVLMQKHEFGMMGNAKSLAGLSSGGPKPLNVPKFDLPTLDLDDELETVVIQKDTSKKGVSQNFADSILNL